VQIISIWRGATDRANKPTGEQNGGYLRGDVDQR